MATPFEPTDIPLPKGWQSHVKAGLLHAMGLAHVVLTGACAKKATSPAAWERFMARILGTRDRLAKTQRELAIKDARMSRVPPRERPHYTHFERLDILALRAACGWSKAETARRFLVESPDTIAHWEAQAKTERPDSLVRLRERVNKYPQYAGAVARQLKEACPWRSRLWADGSRRGSQRRRLCLDLCRGSRQASLIPQRFRRLPWGARRIWSARDPSSPPSTPTISGRST